MKANYVISVVVCAGDTERKKDEIQLQISLQLSLCSQYFHLSLVHKTAHVPINIHLFLVYG